MSQLRVIRKPLELEEPWAVPEGAATITLVGATDGQAPRLSTSVTLFHDGSSLYVSFRAEDDEIDAPLFQRDAALWKHDVVEVFLAPRKLEEYFEFEVSPNGTLFDARVTSPERDRRSMTVETAWDVDGFWGAIRQTRSSHKTMFLVETVMCIPFEALGGTPQSGDEWRANFYRIDRSLRHGDFFAAWQPTHRTPADFHRPECFGSLRFD